jgi:hypothetical protein
MNSLQVKALVSCLWPRSLKSPFAKMCAEIAAQDICSAATHEAGLTAALWDEMVQYGRDCVAKIDGWTVETLGANIESAFDIDPVEADRIAEFVLRSEAA